MTEIPIWFCCLMLPFGVSAQTVAPPAVNSGFGKPALIVAADLEDFDLLPADRRKLIEGALAVARDSPWLPYTARGTKPSDGGFDCSGAMYFVMRKTDLDPPRVAAAQFQWLKRHDRLRLVPVNAVSLHHLGLKDLQPGDLLFWGRPASVDSGAEVDITHVAMFLGYETKNHRAVMINSTDGRSYRGVKANGYGVYDFRLPAVGSKISFIGYGTPPGIAAMPEMPSPPAD